MEECRRSPGLSRWIFYTRTSRIYSARGWSQLSWRLPFGLFFSTGSNQALASRSFRNITDRTDRNNVLCQTHETNLQVLSSTCTGMDLFVTDNSRVYFSRWAVTIQCQATSWNNLSRSCRDLGVAEGKLIFNMWSRDNLCWSDSPNTEDKL